ncbi:MAG: ATP-binding protein [Kovacikia sp.]
MEQPIFDGNSADSSNDLRVDDQFNDLPTLIKMLRQASVFEQTLKQISDQVRDTLDQNQIFQTVVVKLAEALECHYCDVVLYTPDRLNATIHAQYTQPEQAGVLNAPEPCERYPQKHWFAFCPVQPALQQNQAAILACPIFVHQVDQQVILGGLRVFKSTSSSFDEQEICLVEQVANQCAIALRQAHLYETSSDLLTYLSYESRTPLSLIKMAARMLEVLINQENLWEEQLSSSETSNHTAKFKASRYIKILEQECDRTIQGLNNILDHYRVKSGFYKFELATVDLQSYLHRLIETFQPRIQNQYQVLALDINADLPSVSIDKGVLNYVTTELLTNAWRYTPPHETITISARLETEWLCLCVSNTGVEIAPDEIPRLFDKFYRIPNNDSWQHGGMGLGLARVKALIEQANGSIEVTSKNYVTCFTVRLPIYDSDDANT